MFILTHDMNLTENSRHCSLCSLHRHQWKRIKHSFFVCAEQRILLESNTVKDAVRVTRWKIPSKNS